LIRLFRYLQQSMRARAIATLMVMALGVFGLSAWAFLFLGMVGGSYQQIVNRALDSMVPVSRLQQLVYSSAQPVHDFLVEADPVYPEGFERVSAEIDGLFERYARRGNPEQPPQGVMEAPEGSLEVREETRDALLRVERQLMAVAVAEWRTARDDARRLFREDEMPQAVRIATMNKFDRHTGHTIQILGRLYELIEGRIHNEWVVAREAQRRDLSVVMGLLWGALGLAAIIGYSLTRSIVLPLGALQQAAERYATGDFSVPVALDRKDELGQLAAAFNRMGEDLARTHERLEYLSLHDELTGLPNRRAFHRYVEEELARAERFTQPFGLIILDLDHFKQVNDRHGHQTGDRVLKLLAEVLREEVRTIDRPARLGGEEFAVLLPGTGLSGAHGVAERIRERMAREVTDLGKVALRVTVSAGVAAYPDHGAGIDPLVAKADKALYVAKSKGRNRVVHAEC